MKYTHDQVKIAWLEPSFYKTLAEIELSSTERLWSIDDFKGLSRSHNHSGLIAVIEKEVIGFTVYKLLPSDKIIHLENLVVLPAHRRKSVGTFLAASILEKHPLYTMMVTSVRDSNFGSHMFLKKNGFMATKVLQRQYPKGREYEDGYEFVLKREA